MTPFKNGKLDKKGLRELVKLHVNNGTDVISPCGTTGEAATLSLEEHEQVVNIVVDAAGGRVKVLAGTGSNNTAEALRLTNRAGASRLVLMAACSLRPTTTGPQQGLIAHFKNIAETSRHSAGAQPARQYRADTPPENSAKACTAANIVGIKEASGSLSQVSEIINLCKKDFSVISGVRCKYPPIMARAKGRIPIKLQTLPGCWFLPGEAFEQGLD